MLSLMKADKKINRIIIWIVSITLSLIALLAYLGYNSSKEIERVVSDQFNEQQLILARKVRDTINDHLRLLKTDLSRLNRIPAVIDMEAQCLEEMASSFEQVSLLDVLEIRRLDSAGKTVYVVNQDVAGSGGISSPQINSLFEFARGEKNKVLLSDIYLCKEERFRDRWLMGMITSVYDGTGDFRGATLFVIDPIELAKRATKNVKSGRTGYAYIISRKGILLTHYENSFIGKDAFKVRKERNPNISYERLNRLMAEEMLKGREGTDWYITGWHRGVIKEMKKLVAYTPIYLDGKNNLWSVAVTAPQDEVSGIISSLYVRHWTIIGLFLLIILSGSGLAIGLSMRWSKLLEKEVDERTKELRRSESELRIEKEKTEEALRQLVETQNLLIRQERLAAVGQAATWVSHEIKTPLAVIGGFADQLLRSSHQAEKDRKKLEIIVGEVKRLETLLREISDFVKPTQLNIQMSQVNQVIKETLNMMSPALKERNITPSLSLRSDISLIPFDPEKIKQVLINLIRNAVEAISKEGRLDIETDQNRDFVKISIADTGKGIPAEAVSEIFNPFFTTKKEGTGLGLAICYKIVKDHKGEITVSSELGKGSIFVIHLPISR
jgi:two-component system sensor histidine kinase HydH